MLEGSILRTLQRVETWAPPDFLIGLLQGRSREHPFQIAVLGINPEQAAQLIAHVRQSLRRDPLGLEEVTAASEGEWFVQFIEQAHLGDGQVPEELRTIGQRGQPLAVVIPTGTEGIPVLFALRVSDSMSAKHGRRWMALSTDGQAVRSLRSASESEREWQIDQPIIAVSIATQPPRVGTEVVSADEPTPLALLFNTLDPGARAAAAESQAVRAVQAFGELEGGGLAFSDDTSAALVTRATRNLQFAGRLERAIQGDRWRRLTTDRLRQHLSGRAARRWGIGEDDIQTINGRLVLNVTPTNVVRILRDAFGQSVLNEEDLIEGEGRPSERPDILDDP